MSTPVTLDRRQGPYGEVVLRRRDEDFEIIANGTFLMDTSDGRSERLLVDAAMGALPEPARTGAAVLIGGLGVGFSLAHAAADPRWSRIAVVEREDAIVDWHRGGPLAAISGRALADERTVILHTDLVTYLATATDRYDALCLDIDNGPWRCPGRSPGPCAGSRSARRRARVRRSPPAGRRGASR